MISREFIYEFSNFDDISARENDKKTRAMGFLCCFHALFCFAHAFLCLFHDIPDCAHEPLSGEMLISHSV